MYHIDWFVYIEEYLYLWNKSNLIMVYVILTVLLNPVHKNFVEDFSSMFIVILTCNFLVCVCVCVCVCVLSLPGFDIRVMVIS